MSATALAIMILHSFWQCASFWDNRLKRGRGKFKSQGPSVWLGDRALFLGVNAGSFLLMSHLLFMMSFFRLTF